MLTQRRLERIEAVLATRLYGVSVVLESLYNHGNAAAVMRTCDGMGIQRVDLVTTFPEYKCDRKISLGAHKWLDVHRHSSARSCVTALREKGYTILTTHLEDSAGIDEIDFSGRVALVFGNERVGVSKEMMALADGNFKIPMYGFAQSFNISVAAALGLYHATRKRRTHLGSDGDMTPEETQVLRERFYRRSVKNSDLLISGMGT
jgi:tRNA (guanosine-2'-O-)-methyltransferase